jgi:hypothetical protein
MINQYAGTLSDKDLLYDFLAVEVMEKILGFNSHKSVFDVFSLDNSRTVFRYVDRRSFVDLVGKFYGSKWIDGQQTGNPQLRAELMQREFDNLQELRALGLNTYPHCIVRPLAVNRLVSSVLVEEFVSGVRFDSYIWEAINWGKGDELRRKLKDLAWFLADLHNRSQKSDAANQTRGLSYFDKIVDHLFYWQIISSSQRQYFFDLRNRWAASGILGTSRLVLTHGDPIFPNFFCQGEHGIIGIDMERLWAGDRAMDLGCIVAELKHLFYLNSHDIWGSEPYIQHFYESYFSYLPRDVEDFTTLTSRGRFYMGCYELRISRNAWLDLGYRKALIDEAERCLRI